MKIVTNLQSQAFQVLRPFGTFGYLPDAVKAVVERYHFQDYPREIAQLFPPETGGTQQAVAFRHGKVEINGRTIVMEWLQIYPAGLSVNTVTNTTDAYEALQDVIQWGADHFNLTFEAVREPGFWSQLNIHFEKPLAELFPKLKPIAQKISAAHGDFLSFAPQFELTVLHFSYEAKAHMTPVAFRIERAPNVAFDENLYVSDAPLKTEDHIATLEDLERACLTDSPIVS